MQLPDLIKRKCAVPACTHSWRANAASKWQYCSRRCAIEAGRLRPDQDFRDYISATFAEANSKYELKQKRGF